MASKAITLTSVEVRGGDSIVPAVPKLGVDIPLDVFSDILVCEQEEEIKSTGGLILPGEEKKQRTALVLAAGPGRTYENGVFVPNPVKAGDRVVMSKYSSGGEPLFVKQRQYLLLRAGDCVGVLRDGWKNLD